MVESTHGTIGSVLKRLKSEHPDLCALGIASGSKIKCLRGQHDHPLTDMVIIASKHHHITDQINQRLEYLLMIMIGGQGPILTGGLW
jgi:hypothetical protein